MKCEFCPAAWEDRSYEGECNDCGCRIMGHDMVGDDCSLSLKEVNRRLDQLEDYQNGKIERPQWLVNRFMRELDHCYQLFKLDLAIPLYPPKKTNNGVYKGMYGSTDMYYERCLIIYAIPVQISDVNFNPALLGQNVLFICHRT